MKVYNLTGDVKYKDAGDKISLYYFGDYDEWRIDYLMVVKDFENTDIPYDMLAMIKSLYYFKSVNESLYYNKLKNNNNSLSIRNFIRKFLKNFKFRMLFLEKLREQYEKDPILGELKYLDPTNQKSMLINLFPNVISSKIYNYEKELFTYYFTFIKDTSISYALRIGLMFFRDLPKEEKIMHGEVPYFLKELLFSIF